MEVCSYNSFDPNTVLLKINGTACNLCCHYCSEIQKHKPERMSLEYIRDIFENLPKDTSIILHGGEPLLDASYIENIIKLFCDIRKQKLFIQTNGVIDNEMLRVLVKYKNVVNIGISIDGPEEQSSFRKLKNGDTVWDCVNSTIDSLCSQNIKVKCIATIHKKNVFNPELFLDYFLSKKNVTQLRINPCFDVTADGLADYAITPTQFYLFIKEILSLWISKSLFNRIRIDPIQASIEQILSNREVSHRNCSKFVSIYAENMCTLCDSLGDISFVSHGWGAIFDQVDSLTNDLLKDTCQKCSYSFSCNGGCIGIFNRFLPWKDLSLEYCNYRRNFWTLIKSLSVYFLENK